MGHIVDGVLGGKVCDGYVGRVDGEVGVTCQCD